MVSNIFYFHPYLGKWSNLTNIFQMGWNHHLGRYSHNMNHINESQGEGTHGSTFEAPFGFSEMKTSPAPTRLLSSCRKSQRESCFFGVSKMVEEFSWRKTVWLIWLTWFQRFYTCSCHSLFDNKRGNIVALEGGGARAPYRPHAYSEGEWDSGVLGFVLES